MTRYNDDEEIQSAVPDQDATGTNSASSDMGKVTVRRVYEKEATLEKTDFKVMVQLTGSSDTTDRCPLDLVAVLDVSLSMDGEKFAKLKTSMKFLISKLTSKDRLSIVTFNRTASRKCPLRRMNEIGQAEISKVVDGLTLKYDNYITAGLEMAEEVINDRRFKENRVAAFILMSDGIDESVPRKFNLPIYTFGFGKDQDANLLTAIAVNSDGGTFSTVQEPESLNLAFSQCGGGLLTVVAQELTLTLKPQGRSNQKINIIKVLAGSYKVTEKTDGSRFVEFGTLSSKETRTVIVNLHLPEAKPKRKTGAVLLEVIWNYKIGEKKVDPPPQTVSITRVKTPIVSKEITDEIAMEEDRLRTVKAFKDAKEKADQGNLKEARALLDDVQNSLHDAAYEPNKSIEMLKYELKKLLGFMISEKIYNKQGIPFALSCITSHDLQRYATRGDTDIDKLRFFATPRMDTCLEQAKTYNKDPSKPPPSADDDVKKELADDPFAPIIGPLVNHHQTAIQSLEENNNILENVKTIQDLEFILGNLHKAIQSLQETQNAAIQFLLRQLKNTAKST